MPVAESTGALSASIPHLAGAWLFAGPAEFTCAFLGAARPRHPPASKTQRRIPERQLRASASPASRPTLRAALEGAPRLVYAAMWIVAPTTLGELWRSLYAASTTPWLPTSLSSARSTR